MARGGINKAVVQTARLAILARGENPSIDAVRIEMGNTGSKTTIHRYLKELDDGTEPAESPSEPLDDELAGTGLAPGAAPQGAGAGANRSGTRAVRATANSA